MNRANALAKIIDGELRSSLDCIVWTGFLNGIFGDSPDVAWVIVSLLKYPIKAIRVSRVEDLNNPNPSVEKLRHQCKSSRLGVANYFVCQPIDFDDGTHRDQLRLPLVRFFGFTVFDFGFVLVFSFILFFALPLAGFFFLREDDLLRFCSASTSRACRFLL